MKKNGLSKTKLDRRRLWLSIILGILVLCLVTTPAVAKYLSARNARENVIDTHAFYFTSDLLLDLPDGQDPQPILLQVPAGTTAMTFELRNFADQLRCSELDISYTITASSLDGGTAPTCSVSQGTLNANAFSSATVTITGLEDSRQYRIDATGTNGYSKTLGIRLNVLSEDPHAYKYLETDADCVYLTVWTTGSASGTATVQYPPDLIPDNTYSGMAGWVTGTTGRQTGTDTNSFTRHYASYRYRFFRMNSSQTVTVEDFTVTVGGTTATVGQP